MDRRVNPETPKWWSWLNRHFHEVWVWVWLTMALLAITLLGEDFFIG